MKRLGDRVFNLLRDRIVYLDLRPEAPISEQDLCREFKVSRAPVREAIRKLEDMGLVKALPRFGTFVSPIDINEIRSAFEVKKKLEALCASLAVRRISRGQLEELLRVTEQAAERLENGGPRELIDLDTRFHEIIYEAAQNPILHEFLTNLHSRCARLWGANLSSAVPTPEVVGQLKEIYQAFAAGDEDKAARLLEDHVQYFIDKLKERLL